MKMTNLHISSFIHFNWHNIISCRNFYKDGIQSCNLLMPVLLEGVHWFKVNKILGFIVFTLPLTKSF